jgi:hypothetical protein
MGILLLPAAAAVVVVADATSASTTSTRLDDHSTAAYTPPLVRSRKSHPRLNTDINITLSLSQKNQQQSLQQQQDRLQLLRPLSPEELEEERLARKRRSLERKARMRQAFADIPPPPQDSMEPVSQQEFQAMQQNIIKQQQQQNMDIDNSDTRKLSWFGRSSYSDISTVSETYLVDPSQAYDKWAQAYRMLGGYIDCDHQKESDDHHSGDNNNNNQNGQDAACSRWMIWASVCIYYHINSFFSFRLVLRCYV